LRNNPATAHYLDDPAFVEKLRKMEANAVENTVAREEEQGETAGEEGVAMADLASTPGHVPVAADIVDGVEGVTPKPGYTTMSFEGPQASKEQVTPLTFLTALTLFTPLRLTLLPLLILLTLLTLSISTAQRLKRHGGVYGQIPSPRRRPSCCVVLCCVVLCCVVLCCVVLCRFALRCV
jgi:hypothetical protein